MKLWLLKRLKERSTWSGIITLASLAGYTLRPELAEAIITAATAIIAVIFTVTADNKEVKVEVTGTVADKQTITSPELTQEQRDVLTR